MTLIDTLKAQIKRQFIILLVVILCWISIIGIFVWYINQYDFETESTSIIETAIKLNMSERSVNRRRKSIINKIKRVI